MNPSQPLDLAIVLLFAFAANLPLGFLREGSRKYSLHWFVYIHLSIPFIVILRLVQGLGWSVVPFTLACAVAGQLVGGRVRRRAR
ncbi:MAG: hypothetical protein C0617_15010 [Desulfuromonas sp.]|uniref:hypothetical protein n=1 Tax=Desulfuromonas sp. TaxID=892 RepID=UPI000CC084B5|nr:hypothetical protein [Desulfuromonas sp.]PLX82198.1 MAG: hypothetical protein C0617_15010 [Desulfuromonas sp.]